MSANAQRFKKAEVARAIRAAVESGMPNPRVEVDPRTGKIVIMSGTPTTADSAPAANEWDNAVA